MSIQFRIPRSIEQEIRQTLMRPHPFASERVGFVFARLSCGGAGKLMLVTGYEPVPDENYMQDPSVGARIDSHAIRRTMQRVLDTGEGAFHVHIHDHDRETGPSFTDREELRPMMQSIRNAAPRSAHGLLILSRDSAWAEALIPESSRFHEINKISVVGFPNELLKGQALESKEMDRFSRQSFLGVFAEHRIANCRVAIVGLGGGGSHISQQLAHVGFSKFSLFDSDTVEASNLNRLVGGTEKDAKKHSLKVSVAARLIKAVNPHAEICKVADRWQEKPAQLRDCDIVFGCVDSYAERRDLEIAARRYLIPYIDIGLDVHKAGDEPPRMAGQIILSMPGASCMSCLGFLTDAKLAREAEQYGAAGPRPQVVWANGMLGSSAVGIAVDLITDWTRSLRTQVYLSYDSNAGIIQPHMRLQYLVDKTCPHFPLTEIGDPRFRKL
jgi:hypothetical protein